jgi:alcohol dehydrogenase
MKAAVVPHQNGRWEVREIARPVPGPGQVLIKVHASGLCYTDIHQTKGTRVNFPWVLGHEPVGEIVELGAGVWNRRVGDRVGVPWTQVGCGRCAACLRGEMHLCDESIGTGVDLYGGHAEFLLAYSEGTILLPDGLSYEQAAPIFCAGYTVWSGIRMAEPKFGERIAVLGIGGLGHLALQYARAAGFETIAVTKSSDKIPLIKSLGIETVVQDGEELAKIGGADILLCTSNSYEATAEAMKGLRPNGRAMIMGIDHQNLSLSWRMIAPQIRVMAVQMGPRAYLYEALQLAAQGKVKVLTETFSLDEVATAYDRVANGSVRFRAVIKPYV